MIAGGDPISNGRPEGSTIGLAAAKRLRSSGMDEDPILRELERTPEKETEVR